MRLIGIVLWIAGAALAAYAMFGFDPSVDGGPYFGGRIVNHDLQQRQMMMMIAGAIMFGVGVLLHAATHFLPQPSETSSPSAPAPAAAKEQASILRSAYARQIGVRETEAGYEFGGAMFDSLEDAIRVAEPAKA